MPVVDAVANRALDSVLGSGTPANVEVVLLTAAPAADGSGVAEPTAGGYAAVTVANDAAHWAAASGRLKSNTGAITFPTATAAYNAPVTHAGWRTPGASNLSGWFALTSSLTVSANGFVQFAPAGFRVRAS